MKSCPQFDLPVAGDVFNLASELGVDPERIARERAEVERANREARAYQTKMQKTFAECPGFIGGDAPGGPGLVGRLVIEPARVVEAYAWLRRRFRVSENLELSQSLDNGLCIDVITRLPRKCGVWRKSTFAKPEQYELTFEPESDKSSEP